MLNKINLVLNKLAEFSMMDESAKKSFIENFYKGLTANLMADGSHIVSTVTLESVKNSPSEENLKIFFEEMEKSEEGKVAVSNRTLELLENVVEPVIQNLTASQKSEILAILEAK
jgi:hypothetical protein